MAKTEQLRVESPNKAVIDRIRSLLDDVWGDFIRRYEVMKAGQDGFVHRGILITGERPGLKVIADNINAARRSGSYPADVRVQWGSGPTAASKKASATSKAQSKKSPGSKAPSKSKAPPELGVLRIWIPVIEYEWEPGILTLSGTARSKAPKPVAKALRSNKIHGWRVNSAKTSIGLEFDLSQRRSVSNLREALEQGWNAWWIAWHLPMSGIKPDGVQNSDSARGIYSELRTVVGSKEYANLDELKDVSFVDGDGFDAADSLDRPDASVLYDCRERAEAPWKVELVRGSRTKILYEASTKSTAKPLDVAALKNLIKPLVPSITP